MILLNDFLSSNTILNTTDLATISYLDVEKEQKLQNVLSLKYGNLYLISDDISKIQKNIYSVFYIHDYNWTKKYSTLSLIYDTISNVKTTATNTSTASGSDVDSGSDSYSNNGSNSGTVKDTGTDVNNGTDSNVNTVARNNFGGSGFVDNDKTTSSGTTGNTLTRDMTTTNNLTNTDSGTTTYGKNTSHSNNVSNTDNISGYTGLMPQDSIQKEREIAEYNFYEMIADEIITYICNLTYVF